jgi:hypothetical protein
VTQEEKLLARLKTLDGSALYEIIVYVTAEKTIGFWIVEKRPSKIEGETKKCDRIESNNLAANPA